MSKLKELLQNMGNNPDEIAKVLLVHRCFGERKHSRRCPVAIYINKSKVTWPGVSVNSAVVIDDDPQIMLYEQLPDSVLKFVQEFDAGAYPELNVDSPKCLVKSLKDEG